MSRSRSQRRKQHQSRSPLPAVGPSGVPPRLPVPPAGGGVLKAAPGFAATGGSDSAPPPQEAPVPAELLSKFHRQWLMFLVAAFLVMAMGGLSIAGWALYGRSHRAQRDTQSALSDTRGRLEQSEQDRVAAESRADDAEKARADVAAALDRTREALESEQVSAATLGQELESQRAENTRIQQVLQSERSAGEETRRELVARLEGREQAMADTQGKLMESERARMVADTRAAAAERELEFLKEQASRLTDDLQGYRRDVESLREAEKRAAQRLDEVLAARFAAGTASPAAGTGAAQPSATPVAEATPSPPAPVAVADSAAVVIAPPSGPWPTPETPSEGPPPVLVRAGPTALPRPSPEALAAVAPPQDAPPLAFLNVGEDQLVRGDPAIGAELIRQAVEKGGERPEYLRSLGWGLLRSGRPEEAQAAFEKAVASFEDWSNPSPGANPDHWTAAYFLGKVSDHDYARRWSQDSRLGSSLACLPWFYIGQKREIEGHPEDALAAYRLCIELGDRPGAYGIWQWASQRVSVLEGPPPQTRPGA